MSKHIQEFCKSGFTIINLDEELIKSIRLDLFNVLCNHLDEDKSISVDSFFEKFHLNNMENLNSLRLASIKDLNKINDIKERLYLSTCGEIDKLVGSELAIQRNINLSFQLPSDSSSLLPIHSDVWAGNSPFEIVLWIPFVDVCKTKSLYLLPKNESKKYVDGKILEEFNLDEIFANEKDHFVWPNMKFGQALIFSHSLLHGNVVNREDEARISLNLRFKGLNSPYGSKSLGDYFIPFKISPVSKLAWSLYD